MRTNATNKGKMILPLLFFFILLTSSQGIVIDITQLSQDYEEIRGSNYSLYSPPVPIAQVENYVMVGDQYISYYGGFLEESTGTNALNSPGSAFYRVDNLSVIRLLRFSGFGKSPASTTFDAVHEIILNDTYIVYEGTLIQIAFSGLDDATCNNYEIRLANDITTHQTEIINEDFLPANITASSTYAINRIQIVQELCSTISGGGTLRNISIPDAQPIGENSLPTLEMQPNPVIICTDTFPVQANFTTNATDPDNDTIYYASSLFNPNYNFYYRFFTYENPFTGAECASYGFLCELMPDNTSFRVVDEYSACGLSAEVDIDKHFLYNLYAPDIVTDPDTWINQYVIRLNGLCNATDKELMLDTKRTLNPLIYTGSFYNLGAGENFNLSFVNPNFEDIYTFNFENNGTNFVVRSYDETGEQISFNVSASELWNGTEPNYGLDFINNSFGFAFTNFFNGSAELNFVLEEQSYAVSSDILGYDVSSIVRYISYTPSISSLVDVGSFRLQTNDGLDFTTQAPNNLSVNTHGISSLTVYVSDDIHRPTDYNLQTLNVYVYPTENIVCSVPNLPDERYFKGPFNAICSLFNVFFRLGSSIGGVDINIDVCVWLAYALIIIVLGTSLTFATPVLMTNTYAGMILFAIFNIVGQVVLWVFVVDNTTNVFVGMIIFSVIILMAGLRSLIVGGSE